MRLLKSQENFKNKSDLNLQDWHILIQIVQNEL